MMLFHLFGGHGGIRTRINAMTRGFDPQAKSAIGNARQ
jgi:hypothetical protein